MPNYCCVFACETNSKNAKKGTELYKFPSLTREYDRCLRWIRAVKKHRTQVSNTPWELKFYSRICSKHFIGNSMSNHPLSLSYIPTIFPNVKKKVFTACILQVKRYPTNENPQNSVFDINVEQTCSPPVCMQNYREEHNYALKTFCCEKVTLQMYFCYQCNFKSDVLILLKQHIDECHTPVSKLGPQCTVRSYTCNKCTFQTYSMLHWIKHSGKKCTIVKKGSLFHCHHCLFKSLNDWDFEHHLRHSHASVCSWLKCNFHTFKANVKASFISHRRRSLPICQNLKAPKWFECDKCQFKAKSRAMVKIHIESAHNVVPKLKKHWLKCGSCTFTARYKKDMLLHITSEHYERGKWYKCDQCDFKTYIKEYLKRHAQLKHFIWDAPCSLF